MHADAACRVTSKEGVFAEQVYLSVVELSQEITKKLVGHLPIPSDSTADTSLAVQQYKALGCMMTELLQVYSWSLHHAAASL